MPLPEEAGPSSRPFREPRPIVKLSEDVVNQIAAAEIIHRPANAIKELVENSLDAGATSIKVQLKEGGLKSLQVVDNGSGIRKADLPLLCERFATSKIREFSDLSRLTTYGFRGEALASISFVSRFSVVTKVRGEACGWKAYYKDGRLVDANFQPSDSVRPSPANDGTTINAEDLFYNVPLRRKSFKSANEEYTRVIDVVSRYAVHNPKVAWLCKKIGSAMPEISTPSDSDTKSNIGLLYGSQLSRELLELSTIENEPLGAKLSGWISNANWNQRKMMFLMFINHRLVDSTKIRKAVDALYTTYLPKGTFPFVYLSLEIAPERVDVNVHPTKQEVHFMDEEDIIEWVLMQMTTTLANANSSRTYQIQYKIRADFQDRTLESMPMFATIAPSQVERPSKRKRSDDSLDTGHRDEGSSEPEEEESATDSSLPESNVSLKSVRLLRRDVEQHRSEELEGIMRRHQFVGLVPNTSMSLIQSGTRLYLIDSDEFAKSLFYNLTFRQFGALGRIELDPAPLVSDLLDIATRLDQGIVQAGLDPSIVREAMAERLISRREMLEEYFSLAIDEDGRLTALPNVLPGYIPDIDKLPSFLLCAAARVDWTAELECFQTFAEELSLFCCPGLPKTEHQFYQIEHGLFPAIRKYGRMPGALKGALKQVADMPDLYKVFERC